MGKVMLLLGMGHLLRALSAQAEVCCWHSR